MFNFESEITNGESIPAEFRPLYKQDGDKYVLAEETKPVVAALQGQQRALKAARDDAKKAAANKVDLSKFKDFGEDPETIYQAVTSKISELEGELAKGKDGKINLEKIKEDMAKAHANDIKAREAKIEALQGQLYNHLVESKAIEAITSAKGSQKLLMPHVKQHVKVVESDGKQTVAIVDGAGDLRYSPVTGEPMTISELVTEMKSSEDFAGAFASETPKGGGAPPKSGPAAQQQNRGNERSSVEKISAGLKNAARRG